MSAAAGGVPPNPGRRTVLKIGMMGGAMALGGGLLLGCHVESRSRAASNAPFAPNTYLRIDSGGLVTVILPKSEMGQGVYTSIPMVIAEELEVILEQVRVEIPDGIDGSQGTGGSSSIREMWTPLRQAAAAARSMLVSAAAQSWKVSPELCRAEQGQVIHVPSGRTLGYGALVDAAAALPVPSEPVLKDPGAYRVIGRATPGLNSRAKIDGTAVYGIDVKLPGMKIVALASTPVVGGKLKSVDETAALRMPGVHQVVKLDDMVAVVADDYWTATRGVEALAVEWDGGAHAQLDQGTIVADIVTASRKSGFEAGVKGDVQAGMKTAARKVAAEYQQPFLAHAALEPGNCVVHVRQDSCEVWTGTQIPGDARDVAAATLGLPKEKVKLHNYLLGGSFGRRLEADMVQRAVRIGRSVSGPIKVIWSRTEDLRQDYFRPYYVDRIEAGLDRAGKPVTWSHRIAGSSIISRVAPDSFKGVDEDAVECSVETPYQLTNQRVEFSQQESPLRTSWWRGVGPLHSIFVIESFIDELAVAAGADPVAYRRDLLKSPRAQAVLDLAAEKAGWGTPMEKGWGRGVSVQFAWNTYLAQVAEVQIGANGQPRVRRVVVAVDCGQPVNPDGIAAQMEGGVIFGLTAALFGEITVASGRVQQTNFNNYPMLRMKDAPRVETHIVRGHEDLGGIGEAPTAGSAPALCNAIFAATGKRIRRLPVGDQLRT